MSKTTRTYKVTYRKSGTSTVKRSEIYKIDLLDSDTETSILEELLDIAETPFEGFEWDSYRLVSEEIQ